MGLRKKITIFIALTCLQAGILAQDIHYSQFFNTPMLVNPALTGHFGGDWRIANNYRTQWRSISIPYNTIDLAYDRQLFLFNQNFSVGGLLVNDQSGTLGLNINKLLISASYHTYYNNHNIHIGIQPGYVYRLIDNGGLSLPMQWDNSTGTFNNNLDAGESIGERASYFTLNAGIHWNKKHGRYMYSAGYAINNLNRPKDSFLNGDNTDKIPLKQILNAGISFETGNLEFAPSLIMIRARAASEQLYGSLLHYKLKENKSKIKGVTGGAYFRHSILNQFDAAIIYTGISVYKIHAGISYDVNVSALKNVSNFKGAFEFSIVYTELSTIFNKFTIPCDRF